MFWSFELCVEQFVIFSYKLSFFCLHDGLWLPWHYVRKFLMTFCMLMSRLRRNRNAGSSPRLSLSPNRQNAESKSKDLRHELATQSGWAAFFLHNVYVFSVECGVLYACFGTNSIFINNLNSGNCQGVFEARRQQQHENCVCIFRACSCGKLTTIAVISQVLGVPESSDLCSWNVCQGRGHSLSPSWRVRHEILPLFNWLLSERRPFQRLQFLRIFIVLMNINRWQGSRDKIENKISLIPAHNVGTPFTH